MSRWCCEKRTDFSRRHGHILRTFPSPGARLSAPEVDSLGALVESRRFLIAGAAKLRVIPGRCVKGRFRATSTRLSKDRFLGFCWETKGAGQTPVPANPDTAICRVWSCRRRSADGSSECGSPPRAQDARIWHQASTAGRQRRTAVIELRFRGSRQSFTDRFCAQNREAALELPGETHQWNYFPAPI